MKAKGEMGNRENEREHNAKKLRLW